MSEARTFTRLTELLLAEKRMTGFHIQGLAQEASPAEKLALRDAFEGKTAMKGGQREMAWGDWLVESLFPIQLYKENGCSVARLAKDPRIWDIAGFSGGDNYNNSFGRMARPRDGMPDGFALFLLERLRSKYRGMPHFYFDVEHPEWVLEPLAGRPDIPKTGRTAVSCVMNYGFHYLNGALNIAVILRHLNWSHGWGDVYGGHALLQAICKETELPMGRVTIFANSASMDEPKIAKAYLRNILHDA